MTSSVVGIATILCLAGILEALPVNILHSTLHGSSTVDSSCQECLKAAQDMTDWAWDSSTPGSLAQGVSQSVCPFMADNVKCLNVVAGLTPVFTQWLRASTSPGALCSARNICLPSALTQARLMQPHALMRADPAGCAMCTYVVKLAEAAVDLTPDDVDNAVQEAREACGQLPEDLAAACLNAVNAYGPLLSLVLADMDAGEVCQLAGACSPTVRRSHLVVPLPAPLVKLLTVSHQLLQPAQSASGPLRDQSCDVCKMAVMEARTLVTDPAMQANILNYTLTLCDDFPTFADQCKLYVTAYAPLLFSMLDIYLVPEVLCAQMGVCPLPPAAATSMAHQSPEDQPQAQQIATLQHLAQVAADKVAQAGHTWQTM